MSKKTERLLNLLALLRETGRPLSAREIRERVHGYPDSESAFKRAFERDKASLREMGIEVESVSLPASPEGVGYRVGQRRAKLADPGLSPEEKAVMAMAVGATSVYRLEGNEGLGGPAHDLVYGAIKVGLEPETNPAEDAMAYLRVPADRLAVLVEAVLDKIIVEFEYEKADGSVVKKKVEPHGVCSVRSNWYLAGCELQDRQLKAFRIDRICSGVRKVSKPKSFELLSTEEVQSVLRGAPWQIGGGESRTARIAVDASRAPLAQRVFGKEPGKEDSAGRHVFEVEYTNPVPLLEAVLRFRAEAEVLSPIELRSAIRRRLESARANLCGQLNHPGAREAERLAQSVFSLSESRKKSAEKSSGSESDHKSLREDGFQRAKRLVNLVPWLIRHPGAPVEEVAELFNVSKEVIIRDLTTVTLTGVYPYLPHNLVDISWSDGRILVGSAEYLESFADLTVEEGVVLYSALKAASKLPGLSESPYLQSGISKLGTALGIGDSEVEIFTEHASDQVLELLRKAIAGQETVEMTYVSYSSEKQSRRRIDPYKLFVYGGRWYLAAFCHATNEERVFRVSRISDAVLIGQQFGDEDATSARPATLPDRERARRIPDESGWVIDGIEIEVLIPPEIASWFTRAYPLEDCVELDNRWRYIKLKASTLTWAIRILFGLADRVVILSPDSVREDLLFTVEQTLLLYADGPDRSA